MSLMLRHGMDHSIAQNKRFLIYVFDVKNTNSFRQLSKQVIRGMDHSIAQNIRSV